MQISRQLGKETWNIDQFLQCIDQEITSKERYEFLKNEKGKKEDSFSKLICRKNEKTVERPINELYPVKYFNEFTKPAEDENIRQRYKTEGEILADIKIKFCN